MRSKTCHGHHSFAKGCHGVKLMFDMPFCNYYKLIGKDHAIQTQLLGPRTMIFYCRRYLFPKYCPKMFKTTAPTARNKFVGIEFVKVSPAPSKIHHPVKHVLASKLFETTSPALTETSLLKQTSASLNVLKALLERRTSLEATLAGRQLPHFRLLITAAVF